ncbi:hypothetical protein SIN07_04475 [Pediococcus inopinatus]|uniref:Uncharacterized protein n=2 Tax=Pediococcus inopinatus TaxID=114090 RepID=A0ABZ0Q2G5_9LACO|nr:hypothetical protein [Pediococcus inopinatus]AVK99991.1 hypothetical protein PI20285_04665 [Pediococcus inopinatus]KRN63572.1 hypothetical protein IV83_GL000644 [Pediococcus inopinatus]WPC19098.1 hypothetical protein N6G95_07570 [Pediococcus inopinatus]WPC20834.1 hypothetical protein N6G96_05865 [Pediococcus inopinatus]WPP10096.1 hypothetical protein SIN07_04475 [Pediococcus inopinatus]
MLFLFIMAIFALILSILRLSMVIQNGENLISPILLILVCAGLIIYSGINLPFWHNSKSNSTTNNTSTALVSKSSKDFSSAGTNAFPDGSDKQKNAAQSVKAHNILTSLQKNYNGTGTVTFVKGTKEYRVKPTNKDFVSSLKALIKTPANAKEANFDQVVTNFKKLSLSIKKNLGSGYSVSLMNPNKEDQPILTAKDGVITYNYFK